MSEKRMEKKNGKYIIYTILTFVLLSVMFLSLVGYLYTDAEERAMETLHEQTGYKQHQKDQQRILARKFTSTCHKRVVGQSKGYRQPPSSHSATCGAA